MTFDKKEEIRKTQEDIAILQEKLQKLQEQEQEPEMLLMRQGKVDTVDYNRTTYYRIEYTDIFSGIHRWFMRKLEFQEFPFLEEIRDVNVYAPLEELYQKEVVKQKEEYPYKKYTPEETEQSLKETFRQAVKQGVVSSVDKPKDDFIDKMVEELKGQSLYDVCVEWYYEDTDQSVSDLISRIEKWLPTTQSAAGSQNAYVESAVEGYNDAINKIRSKLR